MKSRLLFFLTLFFISFQTIAQVDYVELVIPEALKNNPKAIAYLEKDVKQLNKLFNSIDGLATEFEGLVDIMNKVDTNDKASIEAVRPEVEAKLLGLSTKFISVNFNLMWYIGKDAFADPAATQGIIERMDSDEGRAFKKSMDHIQLKKGLLEARANDFMKKLESLEVK